MDTLSLREALIFLPIRRTEKEKGNYGGWEKGKCKDKVALRASAKRILFLLFLSYDGPVSSFSFIILWAIKKERERELARSALAGRPITGH